MKRNIIILLFACWVLGFFYQKYPSGFSNVFAGISGPSAELQREIALVSMETAKENLRFRFSSTGDTTILNVDKADLKYEMHPSVKKNIDGVQLTTWPIKVSGSFFISGPIRWGIVYDKRNYGYFRIRTDYVAYCYKDSVGQNKFVIEDQSVAERERYKGKI